jgi:hypothetical protein
MSATQDNKYSTRLVRQRKRDTNIARTLFALGFALLCALISNAWGIF